MRKVILYSLLVLVALNAFGHAGEVHTYMGTVSTLQDDGSFTLKKTAGDTMQVHVAKTTAFLHADGKAAQRADLTAGKRVVVTLSKDGKTASTVKIAAPKPSAAR